MHHELRVLPDATAVADAAAEVIAGRVRDAVAERGTAAIAVSGGRTPWAMLATLRDLPTGQVPWRELVVFQVDERVAAEGDPERNLTHLREALAGRPASIVPMPVDDPDLDAAAARYADSLPAVLDLVHLGLGADGHTASLVPGDLVLAVADRLVKGHGGTLTYRALAHARELLWVVTGAEKAEALAALLAGSTDIPAGRVTAARSLILADRAAASG